MLRSDENRERTAYTCIMYMYMYIIISHIYISLYRAFYFCKFFVLLLKFISFFFSFRDDGMPDGRRGKRWRTPVGVFFFLFFCLFYTDKRKIPSSPQPPHIFNTRFVLYFSLFFLSSFVLLYLHAQARHGKSCDARARVS